MDLQENGEEEYEEGEEEYDNDDDFDFDVEAEELLACRLQEQLRADIAKAQLEAAAALAAQAGAPALPQPASPQAPPVALNHSLAKKKQDAILTMKAILAFAAKDPLVQSSLSATIVSAAGNASALDLLHRCVSSGSVDKKVAKSLSDVVVSLAKSDLLFSSLRNSDASSLQLNKGKRLREGGDSTDTADSRAPKRFAIFDQPDLKYRIAEAVQAISYALSSTAMHASGPQFPDPALVSSIQVALHQVFLFAVTSMSRALGERARALQELASLIQMLGVLTGVHIGSGPTPNPNAHGFGAPSDLGTAIFACATPGCTKAFHRLYSLRAHQRLHALVERPFRCAHCPASFLRNHDLKRHARLHEKKAWRCSGCGKVFSRRDAIKRHRDSRGRGGGKGEGDSVCGYAEVEEVELERPDEEEVASRRAKLWNGIAEAQDYRNVLSGDGSAEEGEVDMSILEEAQDAVLKLLDLLRAYVERGQGGPGAPSAMPVPPNIHMPPATLASVMAGTQPPFSSTPAAPTFSSAPPSDRTLLSVSASSSNETASTPASSSLSWLSAEQTRLLEQAISQASSAAQAQAEAEALRYEGEEGDEEDEDEE